MPSLHLLSAAEQVTAHLREEILKGRWGGSLPGVYRLAAEFGVNHKTVGAALLQLEREGLVERQGAGRNRLIILPESEKAVRPMRLGIFHHNTAEDEKTDFMIEFQRAMAEAGHMIVPSRKSLIELKMNVKYIARVVRSIDVDAWVVFVGSREVLEWFAEQPRPAFALAGRLDNVRIAGTKPNMASAHAEVAHRFAETGHRRIVLICRSVQRLPRPGKAQRAFLEALESHGIQTSSYNLPEWEDTPEGLISLLESLFQVTPPTAMLIDEAHLYVAVTQFLSRKGIRVPEDISLVCTRDDAAFAWCRPSIAHITWDKRQLVRHIERWAANVSAGQVDLKQKRISARVVDGGSIGQIGN